MDKPIILYEDDAVVVCVKPSKVLSESGEPHGKIGMPELLQQTLNCSRVYPVHRLDKEVSGVMVYAKTKQAVGNLSTSFAVGRVEKEYLACASGELEPREGLLKDFLYHDKGKNKTYVVKKKRAGVKEAELEYHVLQMVEAPTFISFLAIQLHSGRSHQIRVQFASRKHPLVGDRKYGSKEKCNIALFSHRLCFPHPTTGEMMQFTAAVPDTYPWTLFDRREITDA